MLPVLFAVLLQQAFQVPSAGSAELSGAWRFHAGDSVAWSRPSYPDGDWQPVTVPGRWPAATSGFGWYRARFRFDAVPYHPVAIEFRSVAVAYEVFVDGERLGGVGRFPPAYRARTGVPLTIVLPPSLHTPGEHVIALRVYSVESRGGITGRVVIGNIDEVRRDANLRNWLLLGAALLMVGVAVVQLAHWTGRPDARLHVVLALFGLALAGFFAVWMPAVRVALEPWIFWFRPFAACAAAAAAAACFVFRRLFEMDDDRLLLWLGLGFILVIPLALFLPTWDQVRGLQLYFMSPAALVMVLAGIVFALRMRARGAEYTGPVLVGALFFAVGVFSEVLAAWGAVAGGFPSLLLAGSIAMVLGLVISASRKIGAAETAALYDRLTGLYRREVVMDGLQREISRAARNQTSIAVMMMDLDRFKQINDTLGHQVGDRVLAEVGRRLADAGRAVDWLGRYGGDEFIAVLAATGAAGAVQAAERLRQAVAALPIATGRTARTVTLSTGVASFDGGGEWPTTEQLVGAADAALYRAKDQGRNVVAT